MKKLAGIITTIFAVTLFIPMTVFGLVHLMAHSIFMSMQMFMARLYDWAGYPEVALQYLELLSDKRK